MAALFLCSSVKGIYLFDCFIYRFDIFLVDKYIILIYNDIR